MTNKEAKSLALLYVDRLENLHNQIFDYAQKMLNNFRAVGDGHLVVIRSWVKYQLDRIRENINLEE